MHFYHYVVLFLAALAAGAINAVAGGGTLLTFPALLAVGVPPVIANGTSTVALVPGSLSAVWGYKTEMQHDHRDLLWLGLPSLAGGYLGAHAASHVGNALFSQLVPWLIFGAVALFLIQDPIQRWMAGRQEGQGALFALGTPSRCAPRNWVSVMVFQFFVALYGGFFGAGIGILMLAALGFLGLSNIHRMNGLKNFAAVCINGAAALTFIYYGRVSWGLALLMMVAAMAGGYGGAGLAQRMGRRNVRRLVVTIGILIGVYTLVRPV